MTLSLFFFNDTATTEIYTLSLHDALPISPLLIGLGFTTTFVAGRRVLKDVGQALLGLGLLFLGLKLILDNADRKSTRLNSSHSQISYAVFCLKKKKANVPSLGSRSRRCRR